MKRIAGWNSRELFLLATVALWLGIGSHSISMDFYSLILTMFLTPFISGLTTPLYALRNRWGNPYTFQTINLPEEGLKDHLVIAGGGRVGKHIADVLQRMGVCFVILEFTRQALLHLDLPVERIQEFTDDIRHELYRPLYDLKGKYHALSRLQNSSRLFRLIWITIRPESPLARKSIAESRIRTLTGATLAGILRSGTLYPNPGPDFVLESGDMAGVLGRTEQLDRFSNLAGKNPQDICLT